MDIFKRKMNNEQRQDKECIRNSPGKRWRNNVIQYHSF